MTGDCHAPFWGSPGGYAPGHPTLVLDMVELGFRFAATLRQLVQPGPRPVTVRRPYLLMPWHEILGRAGR